jgi:hypothetical protein
VRDLAEAPTGSAIPAGLAPGLDCARWLQAGSLGGSERNPLGHSQGFPIGTGRVAACVPSWEVSVPPQSTPDPSRPSQDFPAKPRINEDSA